MSPSCSQLRLRTWLILPASRTRHLEHPARAPPRPAPTPGVSKGRRRTRHAAHPYPLTSPGSRPLVLLTSTKSARGTRSARASRIVFAMKIVEMLQGEAPSSPASLNRPRTSGWWGVLHQPRRTARMRTSSLPHQTKRWLEMTMSRSGLFPRHLQPPPTCHPSWLASWSGSWMMVSPGWGRRKLVIVHSTRSHLNKPSGSSRKKLVSRTTRWHLRSRITPASGSALAPTAATSITSRLPSPLGTPTLGFRRRRLHRLLGPPWRILRMKMPCRRSGSWKRPLGCPHCHLHPASHTSPLLSLPTNGSRSKEMESVRRTGPHFQKSYDQSSVVIYLSIASERIDGVWHCSQTLLQKS